MKRLVWLPVLLTIGFIIAGLVIDPAVFASAGGPWSLGTLAAAIAGSLIVLRRPSHPIGWLFTFFAVLTSSGYLSYTIASRAESPTVGGWADAIGSALATCAVLILPAALLRFPDGDLPSKRWRWLSVVIVVTSIVGGVAAFLNGGWGGDVTQAIRPSPLREATKPLGDIASSVFLAGMLISMGAASASLIVRFRRTKGTAREQMKWLAAAAGLLIVALVISFAVDTGITLDDDWLVWLVAVAFAAIPAAVAIAVLRYRLYEIDRIINRTVVYGLTTGAVVAVYAATVFTVSTIAAGSANNLTVAIATLLAAAVFQPALRAVQRFVDRRFYRRRFNVQSTIDGFGLRLSHGTNLDSLTSDLVGVVRSTMQPEHVGIWLRSGG